MVNAIVQANPKTSKMLFLYGVFALPLNINYALNQNKCDRHTVSDRYKHYYGNAFYLNNYHINGR